jgi:hypothetical protein
VAGTSDGNGRHGFGNFRNVATRPCFAAGEKHRGQRNCTCCDFHSFSISKIEDFKLQKTSYFNSSLGVSVATTAGEWADKPNATAIHGT